ISETTNRKCRLSLCERTYFRGAKDDNRAMNIKLITFVGGIFALAFFASTASAQSNWLEKAAEKKVVTFDATAIESHADVNKNRRGKVVVRRIKPQAKSDWNTDPTALPYFFYQLRERTQGKFPIYLDNEGLILSSKEIFDYPIIYFTSHFPFQFSD